MKSAELKAESYFEDEADSEQFLNELMHVRPMKACSCGNWYDTAESVCPQCTAEMLSD